jgi:hypothetical protein
LAHSPNPYGGAGLRPPPGGRFWARSGASVKRLFDKAHASIIKQAKNLSGNGSAESFLIFDVTQSIRRNPE